MPMKRMILLVLALMLAAMPCALAQVPLEMEIVNCEEWVSLRLQPDSASDRCAQVPLGAAVRGFYASHGEFSLCQYDGHTGYILNQYLQDKARVAEVSLPQGEPSYELEIPGGKLKVWRGFGATGEIMRLGCYDAAENLLWKYETESLVSTELSALDVFLNDGAQTPMVMVYNADCGLIALDSATGKEKWTLAAGEVNLGASITHALAGDGTMYIGGYYGPDPVCISPEGEVQWEASSMHEENGGQMDFCWLDSIVVLSDGIAAHYNNCDEPVWVGYDLKGRMISWEKDAA